MPIANEEERKKYQRDYARARRAGSASPALALLPSSYRLDVVSAAQAELDDQIAAVKADGELTTYQRASAIAKLLSVKLRAAAIQSSIKTAERISAIESVLSEESYD